MSDVVDERAGSAGTEDEEFPGSVGPSLATETPGDSELNLSGGQRFWLASATLVGVLAIIALMTVLLRVGADENRGGSATAAGPAEPVTELSIVATEFAFAPEDVTVVAGEELTVELLNDGSVEHEWVVMQQGVFITDEADFDESLVLARTDRISGNGTTTVANMTIDETGTYQVLCSVSGHIAAGMVGSVTVSG